MTMFSRTSSHALIPVLTAEYNDLAKNWRPRWQVHLKTTMRNESHPEREKGYVHVDPQSMTDAGRKRYEGVWAWNHRQDTCIMVSKDENCLDSLIIRELWIRNLPHEGFGHIWYFLQNFNAYVLKGFSRSEQKGKVNEGRICCWDVTH